ncbi:MAG: hypothetical protein H0X01_08930 [Nitrospira sp.]|nr:hypothetical protein [Nitrospira sp.]
MNKAKVRTVETTHDDEYLPTLRALAHRLRVSPSSVRNLRRDGLGSCTRGYRLSEARKLLGIRSLRARSIAISPDAIKLKTEKLELEVQRARFELEISKAEWVRKTEVTRAWRRASISVKNRFLGLGRELAPHLVGRGPNEIRAIIDARVHEILRLIARQGFTDEVANDSTETPKSLTHKKGESYMALIAEADTMVADWQGDKSVLSAQEKRRMIRETLTETREKLITLRQVLEDGDQQLVSLRADEIVNGNRKSERHDTLAQTLADAREQIRNFEREEALLLAEQTVSATVRDAERHARAQAGQRLLAAYQQHVKKLKALVEQARAVNEELLDLAAQLKQSGLTETGTKQLILLARPGVAWNALSPMPIHGNPIHVTDWLAHVDRLLGE